MSPDHARTRHGRALLHLVALLFEPFHTFRRIGCHLAGILREILPR
jgi:hypothetical protein